ncbi:hypothetical protein GQ54DRAFT_169629 [Martensiomyces pterosporus]|nr:hypothetical protein GQ54DRAFT_169629 [Martensiomyces pterosporus]
MLLLPNSAMPLCCLHNRESGNNTQDLLMRLPFDLAVMVAKYFDLKDLYSCSLVSKEWNRLVTSHSVIYPLLSRLSHFDQEPLLFRGIPTGHERPDDQQQEESALENADKEGGQTPGSVDEDPKVAAEKKRMEIEERANQQWLRDTRVLTRLLQKLLNRERRWRKAQPTTRLYLPPVPLDGTDSDIAEGWQGPVKVVKIKGGIVAAMYEEGKSIRIWNIEDDLNRAREITDAYIEENKETLGSKSRMSYADSGMGPSKLRRYNDKEVGVLLDCMRSGKAVQAVLSAIRMRTKPKMFDFFIPKSTLVTATSNGEVDVYDMKTGKHRRTFNVEGDESIGSVHAWLDYVVVGHGTKITLFNHTTGEVVENGLVTAHRSNITGVFILDNEEHLLSVDESGIMIVTNRKFKFPDVDTLLDVPLYPMFLVGQMGAPYSMRLLHMSHLCVWGKYSIGHYELYEPGLQNMPPMSSLIVNTAGDIERQEGEEQLPESAETNEQDQAVQEQSSNAPAPAPAPSATMAEPEPEATFRGLQSETGMDAERLDDARSALRQLEATHRDLEQMYSQVAGDRDDENPQGQRMQRLTRNSIAPEERYHIINIDPRFDNSPEGQVLSVDFRHALFLSGSFLRLFEIDCKDDEYENGASMGLFPVDPQPETFGPDRPPAQSSSSDSEEDEEKEQEEQEEGGWDDMGEWETGMDADQAVDVQDLLHGRTTERAPNFEEERDLEYIETVTMRNLLTVRFAMEHWGLDHPMSTNKQIESAKRFLKKHMPDLYKATKSDISIDALIQAAPYYIQKYHEGKFDQKVVNVNHRGQKVQTGQLQRDMDRIYRAARVGGGEAWQGEHGLVPRAVCHLKHTSAAMDDGRVVVGCQNGYVVVTSFD